MVLPDISHKLINWISAFLSPQTYTTTMRITTHVLMWFIFSCLFALLISTNYPENFGITMVFVIRNILGCICFFYFVFYFLVPEIVLKGYFFLGLLFVLIPFYCWSVINYLCTSYVQSHFHIENKQLEIAISKVVDGGWKGTFSIVYILRISVSAIMVVAPSMSLKLVLGIIRYSTRAIRLERDNLNLEVSFLKSQLNPHFLFNTLNNIYSLSIKKDPMASDLIMLLSEMMRYTLYDSNTEKVPLIKEADFLKNYIELESIRYSKNASITFTCDTDTIQDQKIAPLLMFPFVENAFKYSHSTTTEQCWIHATMRTNGNRLEFEIANSKGETSEKKNGIGGIGLNNTNKRLAILYPDRHTLHIENKADYYKVVLTLTLN
jgi:two-component system LytT family sensor kinase